MGYRPAGALRREIGTRLDEGIQDSGIAAHDELLRVPSVIGTRTFMDTEGRHERRVSRHQRDPRAAAAGRRTAVLAQPRRAWPRRRSSRSTCTASFPTNASEWIDPVGRRVVPEADGRVAGARRRQRGCTGAARGTHRSVRPPAGRGDPRHAAVLRDGDDARRRRHRAAGREPRGPADQGRRQSRSSGQPRRHRSVRAGVGSHPLRSGSLADRSSQLGEIRPWSAFITAMRAGRSAQQATKGAGLRILTETVASPTLAAQMQRCSRPNPAAKWIQWEPVPAATTSRAGAARRVRPVRRSRSTTSPRPTSCVSLDADFLSSEGAANLRYARQFSSRRRVDADPDA